MCWTETGPFRTLARASSPPGSAGRRASSTHRGTRSRPGLTSRRRISSSTSSTSAPSATRARSTGSFGTYVTERRATPWGVAIDYSVPAVREWAMQNAELWVHDFKVDGLRLDATFAIFDDDSPKHVLAELRERLPDTLLIAEQEEGNFRPIQEWGFDAQSADGFHHELHVALTGEQHGHYA